MSSFVQWSTCAGERAALGGGGGSSSGGLVGPLGGPFQQVVQAAEASGQIAEQTLLPGTVLRWQPAAAHVGRGVGGRVPAGVAQRLVGMGPLSTNTGQRSRWTPGVR